MTEVQLCHFLKTLIQYNTNNFLETVDSSIKSQLILNRFHQNNNNTETIKLETKQIELVDI